MRFTITSVMALMASLNSAFVIETYSGSNCEDSTHVQHVNTWDNTCADWPNGFQSFKITKWGGRHQYAYFFAINNCGYLPGAIGSGYVDSTTYDYKLNECYAFNGAWANAIASYYK